MRATIISVVACGVAIVAGYLSLRDSDDGGASEASQRDLKRSDLELRDGDILFAKGEDAPFIGTMSEYYPDGQKRVEIEIRRGKPNGISRGWYESGQLEVEETFVEGVSHGTRTRWYESGNKKSVATIVDGVIEGVFTRWHDNGNVAAEAEMKAGKPHGVSQAWFPSGQLKSRVVLEGGEVVNREFFEESEGSL